MDTVETLGSKVASRRRLTALKGRYADIAGTLPSAKPLGFWKEIDSARKRRETTVERTACTRGGSE